MKQYEETTFYNLFKQFIFVTPFGLSIIKQGKQTQKKKQKRFP